MNADIERFTKCYYVQITLRIVIMADQAANTSKMQKSPLRRTEIQIDG